MAFIDCNRLYIARGQVGTDGWLHMAGRRFNTIAVLFEPLPPSGLLPLLEEFSARGGKVIWSGPPPRLDFSGASVSERWRRLFGVSKLLTAQEGLKAAGFQIGFEGALARGPSQFVLTDYLVDWLYPVEPDSGAQVVARSGNHVVGLHRALAGNGSVTFLGFRPRDDQAASLGVEMRTWFNESSPSNAWSNESCSSNAWSNNSRATGDEQSAQATW